MTIPNTPPSQVTDLTLDLSAMARTVVASWALALVEKAFDVPEDQQVRTRLEAQSIMHAWCLLVTLPQDEALELAKAVAGYTAAPITAAVVPL